MAPPSGEETPDPYPISYYAELREWATQKKALFLQFNFFFQETLGDSLGEEKIT
jgi:hypothetical protein